MTMKETAHEQALANLKKTGRPSFVKATLEEEMLREKGLLILKGFTIPIPTLLLRIDKEVRKERREEHRKRLLEKRKREDENCDGE